MKTEPRPDVEMPEADISLMHSKLGGIPKLKGDDRKTARRLRKRIENHEECEKENMTGNCETCGHFLSGFEIKAKKNGKIALKLTEEERQWLTDYWLKLEIKENPPIAYEERLVKIAGHLGPEFQKQAELAAGLIEEEKKENGDDSEKPEEPEPIAD
jgi:hypothetical protein